MFTIRSFIALPSSSELRNVLSELQDSLKLEGGNVKWDTPDKFHITLKFLGNVPPEKLDILSDSLAALTTTATRFQLVYATVGAFPDLVHPRVIWAGAEMNEDLSSLQHRVEDACDRLDFPQEPRTFHPHITLGRVKGTRNLGRLTAKVKSITFDAVRTDCSEVLLIKSDLHPTGSVYTTLKSFPLKAQPEFFHDRQ